MSIFDFLFKKRTIAFQGRAGLHCFYGDRKYLIDSEMLNGPPYDIVIYTDNIFLVKNKEKHAVDNETKETVLEFAKVELEKLGIKADFS